jgi:hypothetical protein
MADIISSEPNEPEISTEEYVRKSFKLFLGREPEEEALKGYTAALDNQSMTKSQLCILLVESEEYQVKARSGFHLIKQDVFTPGKLTPNVEGEESPSPGQRHHGDHRTRKTNKGKGRSRRKETGSG